MRSENLADERQGVHCTTYNKKDFEKCSLFSMGHLWPLPLYIFEKNSLIFNNISLRHWKIANKAS